MNSSRKYHDIITIPIKIARYDVQNGMPHSGVSGIPIPIPSGPLYPKINNLYPYQVNKIDTSIVKKDLIQVKTVFILPGFTYT